MGEGRLLLEPGAYPRPAVVMFLDRAPQADHNTLKSLPSTEINTKSFLTQFLRGCSFKHAELKISDEQTCGQKGALIAIFNVIKFFFLMNLFQ